MLGEKGISYFVSGKSSVDLANAVNRLGEHFGIRTLLLEGGGHVNGAFLEAGLVDHLTLQEGLRAEAIALAQARSSAPGKLPRVRDREERRDLARCQRTGEQEALPQVRAQGPELGQLAGVLDPFGDGLEVERLAQLDRTRSGRPCPRRRLGDRDVLMRRQPARRSRRGGSSPTSRVRVHRRPGPDRRRSRRRPTARPWVGRGAR